MDLENVVQCITDLEKSYTHVVQVNADLTKQIKVLKDKVETYESSINVHEANNKKFLETIKDLQATITNQQSYRDQKNMLMDEVCILKQDKEKIEEGFKEKIFMLETKLRDMEELHQKTMQETTEDAKLAKKTMEYEFQKQILTLEQRLEDETRMKQKNEQDRIGEISRLTMQYENKLAESRSQQIKLQNKTQNTIGNEIFRKKLQHVQEESQRKENFYQSKIKQLESRLQKENRRPPMPKTSNIVPNYSNHLNNYLPRNRGYGTKTKKP